MNISLFICPVCRSPLSRGISSYLCANSHTYDLSKEGYVNLLLANQKQSREPGDSKEMLEARKSFLNKGYYKQLARAVTSLIIKHRRHSHKLSYCQRRASTGSADATCSVSGVGSVTEKVRTLIMSKCPLQNPAAIAENAAASKPVAVTEPVEGPYLTILDAGCGEGYYTEYISKNKNISNSSVIYGIDISRDGIKYAAKRNSGINFAVAGIYNLPIADNSIDALLNIFAPFNAAEFHRVLKDNGVIISVTPGAYHLYELKKNLYDEVYVNDEAFELPDKFYISETVRVKYELNINENNNISNLLKMTPYYHKTEPERMNSFLKNTEELKTTADFVIRILKKNKQD